MPFKKRALKVSTHSRAEAAAPFGACPCSAGKVSTHSRAEAAANDVDSAVSEEAFQHTAARRRLHIRVPSIDTFKSFNTQPRGGGC